jgi:hypothetical protein
MSENINRNEKNLTTFTPIIKGTNVVALKINNKDFLMKGPIEIKEFFEKLLPSMQKIDKYFDFDQVTITSKENQIKTKWNFNIFQLFWSDLSEIQKKLIEIVFVEKKILRGDLISKLFNDTENSKNTGFNKKLAGISASITRKWNRKKMTPIWNIRRNYYEINVELYPIIKETMEKWRNFYDNE